MTCGKAHRWMQLAIDGELLPHRQASLEMHCRRCPVCRAKYVQLTAIHGAFTNLAEQTGFASSSSTRIEFASPNVFCWQRASLAAAVAIVFLAGGWLIWLHGADSRHLAAARQQASAPPVQPSPPPPAEIAQATTPVTNGSDDVIIEFKESSRVIAVPMDSGNPNITILWLYPMSPAAQAAENGETASPSS